VCNEIKNYFHRIFIRSVDGEDRFRVFENRVLRRIFGPTKEEVAGGWRRLHNKELHNLYTSPNIRIIKSRRMICMGRCSTYRRDGEMHKYFVWKT
jgi:hypothetical protein